MSDKKLTFHQKRSNLDAMIGAISKDKSNPYFKSNYADINTILAVVKEPISECGLRLVEKKYFDKDIQSWVINLKIVDIDNPEQYEETISPIITKTPNDPQVHIAGTTYARRDAHVVLLNLTQSDDDGNTAANVYNKTQSTAPQKAPSTKEKFVAILLGNGLNKEDFTEFTGFMKGHKGIDLANESEKMKLIANIPLLKQFITEFKDYANKQ